MRGSQEGHSYYQKMDQQSDYAVHSDMRGKVLPNFTAFVTSTTSPSKASPPRQDSAASPPHFDCSEEELSSRRSPLPAGFTNVLTGKPISWACNTWKTVCKAVPKQGFLCAEEGGEPDLHVHKSSPEVKCCHQSNLEIMAAPERRLLLCMLKQPLLKGHVFPHADEDSLHCDCVHQFAPHFTAGSSDNIAASSIGIFLQKHAKDCGGNLARRLLDGNWTRTRLHNLGFARLQGEPGMMCRNSYRPGMEFDEAVESYTDKESPESPLALLQRISFRAAMEKILHKVPQQQLEFPDKEMLDSVQDFFLYTEVEGRQVFEEIDRDADGKLTMADIKVVMEKMKLPANYAKDFMQKRRRLWPSQAFGWLEFSSLIQEKEPVIIQLFNSLGVSRSGTVSRMHIKESLKKAGVSATEANVTAMMNFLAVDRGDHIKYGEFRRFMLLLPIEQLTTNPWNVWLEAATGVVVEHSSPKDNLHESVFKHIQSVSKTFQIGANLQRFESEAIPC